MIKITEKYACCGCTACASACPRHCITMEEDAEGFKYPKVNTILCTDCGLCEKSCPMAHPESYNNILQVIATKHNDETVRKASSSGGTFSLLAENIILQGGVVVGCAMDEQMRAKHIFCEKKENLSLLRSSKYVQSDIKGIYPLVRSLLRKGRKVLFTGTPCQVAGLHRYLHKPYDNLFCIDVLCHGVPSPKLLDIYKSKMESKYGSKAEFINFRYKKCEWKRLYTYINFKNGKQYYKYSEYDVYMNLFLSNRSQRSSCFHCPFTSIHRQGDISLGDFWGIGKFMPEWDDDKGISLVLLNNEKGKMLFESIANLLDGIVCDTEKAIAGNKVLCENIIGEDRRNAFYSDFVEYGYDAAIDKHVKIDPYPKQLYFTIMRRVKDRIYKIIKKGY